MSYFKDNFRQWLIACAGILLALVAVLVLLVAINMLAEKGVSLPGGLTNSGENELGKEQGEEREPAENDLIDPSSGMGPEDEMLFFTIEEEKMSHKPYLEIAGVEGLNYLRIDCREFYFGYDDERGGWHHDQEMEDRNYRGEEIDFAEDILSEAKVVTAKPVKPFRGYIPVKPYTTQLSFPLHDVAYFPERNSFFTADYFSEEYEFSFHPLDYDPEQLKTVPWEYDQHELQHDYTHKYHTITDDYLNQLVYHDIAPDMHSQSNPYETVVQITDYLKNNYRLAGSYFINTGKYKDIVTFLFEDYAGSEMHFNTALALMTREAAIPSRLAIGFRTDPERDYQVVYLSQLYAYVEIYFDHLGWVPFDAVPEYSFYQPPEPTTTTITARDQSVIKGETLAIEGEVTGDHGEVIDDMPLLIYLQESPEPDDIAHTKNTLTGGAFTAELDLDGQVFTGPGYIVVKMLENDQYRTSLAKIPVEIYAETRLELLLPQIVYAGDELQIEGRLTEKIAPLPVASEKIRLDLRKNNSGNPHPRKELITDQEGFFDLRVTMDPGEADTSFFNFRFIESEPVTITATYTGADYYYSSYATAETTIVVFYWQRLVFLLFLFLVAGFGAFAAVKVRRKRREPLEAGPETAEVQEHVNVAAVGEVLPSTEKYPLAVIFPDIEEPFPAVWGVNEVLRLKISEAAAKEESLSGRKLQIVFGDGSSKEFLYTASVNFEHIYYRKGAYGVSIKDLENERIYGLAAIKIVDYREEIIEQAHQLFVQLGKKGLSLSEDLTPRELFETSLAGLVQSGQLTRTIVQEITLVFDYATYSLKEIDRADYKAFYRLLIKITSCLEE